MASCVLPLLAALLLGGAYPLLAQQAPADTMRVVPGYGNQLFAWGTLALRKGRLVQAYLPATTTGLDKMVLYYPLAPDGSPAARPKVVALDQVRWMRVRGQYSELLGGGQGEPGRLAARRVSGPVELFMRQAYAMPMVSFLGPTPVLSSPATSPAARQEGPVEWYLRRPGGPPGLVNPANFASQVAAFLADDAELARRVAAGQPGYRLEELENVVRQYNKRKL